MSVIMSDGVYANCTDLNKRVTKCRTVNDCQSVDLMPFVIRSTDSNSVGDGTVVFFERNNYFNTLATYKRRCRVFRAQSGAERLKMGYREFTETFLLHVINVLYLSFDLERHSPIRFGASAGLNTK